MHTQQLGHVVLNVHDVGRSEAFYAGVLSIPIATRMLYVDTSDAWRREVR
jgi:catechol-2,3-dioxygenase